MREIPLLPNLTALVDDEDYEWLTQWPWHVGHNYALRGRRNPEPRKPYIISMQRHIMQPPPGYVVDHLNGDSLDNRRANLRVCTQRENCLNQPWHRTEHGRFITRAEIERALPRALMRKDPSMVHYAVLSGEIPSIRRNASEFIRRADGEAYVRRKTEETDLEKLERFPVGWPKGIKRGKREKGEQ